MNREELYRSIYTHETIYMPPIEQNSAALEVCLGCTWGKCRFCDFAKDQYQLHSMDAIEHNASVLAQLRPDTTRMFLLGENTFSLRSGLLMDIFGMCRRYFPRLKSFAMYARIDDILDKSPGTLMRLKDQGLDGLHIGVESGSDTILLEMNKGFTSMDTLTALKLLDEIEIPYYVTIIPGLGGRLLSKANAIETARLLNKVHPRNIWALKLKLWEDTPLFHDAQKGYFQMMTDREILLEERILLNELKLEDTFYVDTTVMNKYTIQGWLQDEKPLMLRVINQLLAESAE